MLRVIFVLVLTMVYALGKAYAQDSYDYRFERIDNFSGLPNNSVWTVETDIYGFIWIATADGLCRIETDNRIKVYSEEDYPELKSSNIRALLSDSEGNLWIGTRHAGLTYYNQKTDEWKHYSHDINDEYSLVHNEILSIEEDKSGNIWVGTENGLSIYRSETDNFYSYRLDESKEMSLRSKAVLNVFCDHNGWIWLGTWGSGMYLVLNGNNDNLDNLKFRQILPLEGEPESYNVWTISQDNQNRYWVGTYERGLFNLKIPETASNEMGNQIWEPSFFSFSSDIDENLLLGKNISDVIMDNNNDLWIGTTNGINKIEAEHIDSLLTKEIKTDFSSYVTKIEYLVDDPYSIPFSTVYSLLNDDQGLIWVATAGGIGLYNPNKSQFYNYPFDQVFGSTMFSQNIYVNDKRQSWICGYNQGLTLYDHDTNSMKFFDQITGREFNHGTILSLFQNENKLYVTTTEKLVILDLDTYKEDIVSFNDKIKHSINYSTLSSTYLDTNGRFFIATVKGLIVIDIVKDDYRIYLNNPKDSTSLVDNSITNIFEDSKGHIWVSTYNGLSMSDSKGGIELTFKNYKYDSANPNSSICGNQVICMTEADGYLFFGLSAGMCSYNLSNDTFERITEQGENYYIQSIVNIGDHTIYAGSMEGILSYDIGSKKVKLYNENDGLPESKFVPLGTSISSEGHAYFSTIGGIVEIDPDLIYRNTEPPNVYVTDIKVLSPEGERIYSGLQLDKLELNEQDYYLSVNFASTNNIQRHRNKYAFRLLGFEESWNYPDRNITNAVYTNLKPGDYTLEVKARNNDGVWNEVGYRLPIVRKPSFLETSLFKILAILLTLFFIYVCFKLYTRNVRLRNMEMENLVSDRTLELAAKNKQVENLLSQLRSRNTKLEEIVAQRTANLVQSNNELLRSNNDLEQFAHVASHDLQEPLRTIGTFVSLLERQYKDSLDEKAVGYINFVVDGVSRMSSLIKSILTYSKVGKEIDIQELDLNVIVASKLIDLSKRIEDSNANVIVEHLPTIKCDGGQLGMVFYNLINNGIKFNKSEKPEIRVSANYETDSHWGFSVSDNGIGIKKEYQEKIFELFNRLHLKSEYEGTGIGLTLCKLIVSKHEGRIWIESNENQGTVFHFSISKNIKLQNNKVDVLYEEEFV